MGQFTDRIKNMFSKKPSGFSEEQEKLIKQLGGRKNVMRFHQMKTAVYFIRLSDNPDFFLHPIGETKDQLMYQAKKGIVGAAIWPWKEGLEFINQGTKSNLEMVLADKKFLDEHNPKSKPTTNN